MRGLGWAVVMALVLAAVPAVSGEPPAAAELAALTERGRTLAIYDGVLWRAVDAVLDSARGADLGFSMYLVQRTPEGWRVVFGDLKGDGSAFLVAREAISGVQGQNFEVIPHEMPLEDVGYVYRAALAQKTAMAVLSPLSRPFHPHVVPGPDGGFYVYVVPLPQHGGAYPNGGDFRFTVSADGGVVKENRPLHNAILENDIPESTKDQEVFMLHVAVRDDRPEDTDVFAVLVRRPKAVEVVLTRSWAFSIATDGTVTCLGDKDKYLAEIESRKKKGRK